MSFGLRGRNNIAAGGPPSCVREDCGRHVLPGDVVLRRGVCVVMFCDRNNKSHRMLEKHTHRNDDACVCSVQSVACVQSMDSGGVFVHYMYVCTAIFRD